MSQKYSGGFITKSPVAPTSSAASGIWTLDQQQQAQKAGTWPSPPVFIEDLFSTYLYTGNGSTQTINNGIDVSGKGGLVWIKDRSYTWSHSLFDTARGTTKFLQTNSTSAELSESNFSSFNSNGFSMSGAGSTTGINSNGDAFVAWTFAEQPKFFDIVTYTGDGTNGRAISHSLGSTPGFIIVKSTSDAAQWVCWSRGFNSGNGYGYLNDTTAWFTSGEDVWGNGTSYIAPTSTTFTVKGGSTSNLNGRTYVAYLFAHDAGGFPVSGGGSTNGISCGSWTGTGSTFTVNLGYEPQWLMFKRTDDVGDWIIIDNMRGVTVDGADAYLRPNTSGAESNITGGATLNSTGFSWATGAGSTFIYIAIRRGPMKTPTVGTSVLELQNLYNLSVNTLVSSTVVPDMVFQANDYARYSISRLTGGINTASSSATSPRRWLYPNDTSAEDTTTTGLFYEMQNASFRLAGNGAVPAPSVNLAYFLKRAPGFMDVVCYTGTGTATTFTHNLGVVPELMIVKTRSLSGQDWAVYSATLGNTGLIYLNQSAAANTGYGHWNSTSPTSTVFSVGGGGYNMVNGSGATYVNYLFATVAGVSKVGSYTGTGALQTVNCGFTAGARFVLIKRTDSTGGWYLYDSARGITSGNDPYLFLNTASAEVTGTNYVDTDTTGFQVTAAAPAGLNANGGTYIFLAIA